MNNTNKILFVALLFFGAIVLTLYLGYRDFSPEDQKADISWNTLSSKNNQLPTPLGSDLQTASLILDIDKDGKNDFIIASRRAPNSVVWYRRTQNGWEQNVIDSENINIEAGGDYFDIDNDGDLDISFAGDSSSEFIYWWENPYPNFPANTDWEKYTIKNSGSNKHHDQAFGDVDGDGKTELVFWNQKGTAPGLYVAEIPENPKTATSWPSTKIFNGTANHEGLAIADIDIDGKSDIVGAGLWFKHTGGNNYQTNTIDSTRAFTRVAVGQLKKGERPEVVFSAGDTSGTADMYQWNGSSWAKTKLFDVVDGHSLQILDVNKDQNLDVFSAEMRKTGGNPNSKVRILYGDGNGSFQINIVATGLDVHEGRMADLDGDGDFDILAKPYDHETPNIVILLQEGEGNPPTATPDEDGEGGFDNWERKLVGEVDDRKLLAVSAVNVDDDTRKDIVSGGSWWKQPNDINGNWTKNDIATGFDNFFLASDFNGDSKIDLLGSRAVNGSTVANRHNSKDVVWAKSDSNTFSLMDNIPSPSAGDFPQGLAEVWVGTNEYVAISWHRTTEHPMQLFKINGETNEWELTELPNVKSQNEGLIVGDIDGDNDEDILQGTKWMRNNGQVNNWTQHILDPNLANLTSGIPDRVFLKDFRGVGKLDAIVSLESGEEIIYYKNPGGLDSNPNQTWERSVIYNIAGEGFSMDIGDINSDGNTDIVLGEHKGITNNRVIILENLSRANSDKANNWVEHIIDSQPKTVADHHVGTQIMDIDDDDDLDVISIGWLNTKVWLYINTSSSTGPNTPTPSQTPPAGVTNSPTPTNTPTVPPLNSPTPTRTLTPTYTPPPVGSIVCGASDTNNDGAFTLIDFSEYAGVYGEGRNNCSDSQVNYGACGGRDMDKNGLLNFVDFGTEYKGFAQRYYPKSSCALP